MLATWTANRMFKVIPKKDAQRVERQFVVVDEWAV
jgi:hypothetical protein